jgi:plasmid stabilization system protein ParE
MAANDRLRHDALASWAVAKLVWTHPALRDIQRLHAFPVPKNPDAARRAVRAIRQGVKALAAHPMLAARHGREVGY